MIVPDGLKVGERRTATILFSDMKGFTSLSERMDPEEMDALMGRVFGLFEEIIHARGGMVEKYIGDALVAVFGVTELHEDDASRAIDAALEFLDRVRGTVGPGDSAPLSFRTGIHTGLVTTGRRGEFDVVTGHAMSIAQRLEAAAEPGTILVSETTQASCKSEFEFSEVLEIMAKGKTEAIRAFVAKGRAAGELNDEGPFVGRRDELDALLKAYLRHDSETVSGFFVSGPAGIGKTRLAQAFVDKLRRFPDFDTPILAARAWRNRPGALAVIVDLILDGLLLSPTAAQNEIEAELARYEGLDGEGRRIFARLCCIAETEALDPRAMAVTYTVFSALVEARAASLYHLVIIIDDAQAIDEFSLSFFRYFNRTAKHKPFFVLTGRDFAPGLRRSWEGLSQQRLQGLPGDQAAALARAHWPGIEKERLAHILEASEGNPLFIREYALWAKSHRDASSIPGSVQNIFLAALERFSPAQRDLARKLSVFLHSFNVEEAKGIEAATGGDSGVVADTLAAFASEGLIVGDKVGNYCFRVGEFRKALYASLLNHNKRILHGIIADMLMGREKSDRPRLVAHLVRADRYGEAARAINGDPDRGLTWKYLPLIDTLIKKSGLEPDDIFALLVTKSRLLFNRGRLGESEEVLRLIMRRAIQAESDLLMGYAYHYITAHSTVAYSFQKSVFTGRKALYYYDRANAAPQSVQNVLRYIAQSQVQRAELDEARRLVERCESVPGGSEADGAEARSEYHLLSGDYMRALSAADKCISLRASDDVAGRFYGLDLKLKAQWQLCDLRGVRDTASEILASGFHAEGVLSQASSMLGIAALRLGSGEPARDAFVQAEIRAGQVKNDFEKLDALRTLALCRHLAGDTDEAEKIANEGLTLGLRHSSWWPTFTLLMVQVEIEWNRGKTERGRFWLAEAAHLFASGFLLPAKDQILYYWFAAKLGKGEDARRNLAVAGRLLGVEKARLADPALIEAFLATRSFPQLQSEFSAISVEASK